VTSQLTTFALKLAAAARAETLPRWRDGVTAEHKGDGAFDPVTDADREGERVMRALIEQHFPDHGVSGEEFGVTGGTSPFTWSLDPVDGTRSFMCRLPTWTTLIALLEDGEPVLGVIDAPVLGETYVGRGGQSWLYGNENSVELRTSGCTTIDDARLSTTDPYLFNEPRPFERIRERAKVTRYSHDGYAYACVAAGTLDLVIESGLKAHDYNALIPVVRGAGGHIGDWTGGCDFTLGQVIAAATRELYDEAVALLSE
jgi:myo-inositol-1(or 4)-monophosphatase